jgi:hypothetical protein
MIGYGGQSVVLSHLCLCVYNSSPPPPPRCTFPLCTAQCVLRYVAYTSYRRNSQCSRNVSVFAGAVGTPPIMLHRVIRGTMKLSLQLLAPADH